MNSLTLANYAKTLIAIGSYEEAEKNLKQAIAKETLSFWKAHDALPAIYHDLAIAQQNQNDYSGAAESYEREVELLRSSPQAAKPDLAFACYCAGSENLIIGRAERASEQLREACDLYDLCSEEERGAAAGRAYAAHAKISFSNRDYITAIRYHEKAVPTLVGNTVWGDCNDAGNALMLAISYRQLALAYVETGDDKRAAYYDRKYHVFAYLRSLSDNDVDEALSPTWVETAKENA